jgi:PGF-pre-PGF domain-containing protein
MTGGKKSLTSLFVTISVILLLILSQPASSLIVTISGPTQTGVNQIVALTGEIIIQSSSGEWTNISEIRLNITGSGTDTVLIPVNITPGVVVVSSRSLTETSSTLLNITVNSTTDAIFGYGYGYGYVNGSIYGSSGWSFGYGAGYGYDNYSGMYGYNVMNSPDNAKISFDVFWKPAVAGSYIIELTVILFDRDGVAREFSSRHSLYVQESILEEESVQTTGGGGGGALPPAPLSAESEYYESITKFLHENEVRIMDIPWRLREKVGITEFRVKHSKSGSIVVTLSKVSSLPEGIPEPEGAVYSIFEIVFTQYGTRNRVDITGNFIYQIDRSWLSYTGIKPSDIFFLKYTKGKWNELPAEVVDEDEEYVYYNVKVDSFSLFAVISESKPRTSVGVLQISEPYYRVLKAPTPVPDIKPFSVEEPTELQFPLYATLLALVTLILLLIIRALNK